MGDEGKPEQPNRLDQLRPTRNQAVGSIRFNSTSVARPPDNSQDSLIDDPFGNTHKNFFKTQFLLGE